ncbi:hypothetical protein [Nocardia wallacei]|uniref:hypothetical protein n=1 Tax=Nocardia wallacei TaxID=480035 RepID=UPI002453A607|nr:hypothetical protein [Nocardia wallacei]
MIHTTKPEEWSEQSWAWYRDEWLPEATRAARGHLFAAHLPAATLAWGACGYTTTDAVQLLGARIRERWWGNGLYWRGDRSSWREIADILDVPVPIAMAWAAESLVRRRRMRPVC